MYDPLVDTDVKGLIQENYIKIWKKRKLKYPKNILFLIPSCFFQVLSWDELLKFDETFFSTAKIIHHLRIDTLSPDI